MLIKEIYKFSQYFELVTVDYKRIPAVSLYQTSDMRLCFLLFSQRYSWQNGSLFLGGLPSSLAV